MSTPQHTPPPKGLSATLELAFEPPLRGPADPVHRVALREPTAGEMRLIRAKPLVDREIFGVGLVGGVHAMVAEAMPASRLFEGDAYLWAWADEAGLPLAEDAQLPELVIPLDKPISHGEVRYTELRLREPTGEQVRTIRRADLVDQQIAAVSAVSGLPDAAVAQIGIRAVTRAEAYIVGFIEAGRRRLGGR